MSPIAPEHVDQLAPELQPLLQLELRAGNAVAETHHGWPHPESILVLLAKPFRRRQRPLPPGVTFRLLDDPHYWKAEYVSEATGHILACGFDRSKAGSDLVGSRRPAGG